MKDLRLLILRIQLMARLETNPMRKMVLEESVKTITTLADENQSLWAMLDEMKASDIANHRDQIGNALAKFASLLGAGKGDA